MHIDFGYDFFSKGIVQSFFLPTQMKLNRFTWSNLMFMNFQFSPKKIITFFLFLPLLVALAGCKPEFDLNHEYDETYHIAVNEHKNSSFEIMHGSESTLSAITSDHEDAHLEDHEFTWDVYGEHLSEWIFNGDEYRDKFSLSDHNANFIRLKSPKNKTSEIKLTIIATCPHDPKYSSSTTFVLKSIFERSLEQLYEDTQNKASQIDKIIELEMPEPSDVKKATL